MFILLFLLLFANKGRIGDGFSIYTNNSPNYSDVSYLKPFILDKLTTIDHTAIRNGETVLWTVTDIILVLLNGGETNINSYLDNLSC